METAEPSRVTAEEVLVLDSSTFIEEAGLTSRGASALKHYLCHRGTQLVVPEVVAEECERTLAGIAKGKVSKIEETLTWLARFCGRVNGWTAPRNNTLEERAKMLSKAHHLQAVVLPETETVRARAESRNRMQRPPNHRRAGLGDCRIWEQCLELLAKHDVVFVAGDGDFRGHRNRDELHPQLQAEAEAVGAGQTLTFHPNMESLLCELRREIPSIPKDKVLAFVYEAAAADIDELKSNSDYRPKRIGDVALTLLTTDQADVIEVRLEVDDKWENSDEGRIADFSLRASCRYRLTDCQLHDLDVWNIRLMVTQPDGSVRAAKGSYLNVSGGSLYAGETPIQTKPEILG